MTDTPPAVSYRPVAIEDFERCIEIRGMTRDNLIPAEVLTEIGVTRESWAPRVRDGTIRGVVAECGDEVVGFCSGDATTGEVLVLAVLPEFEDRGVGTRLLDIVTGHLFLLGWDRLWLAAPADPAIRAHGFYRRLGWRPTGTTDQHGDEVLEYRKR